MWGGDRCELPRVGWGGGGTHCYPAGTSIGGNCGVKAEHEHLTAPIVCIAGSWLFHRETCGT